MKLPEEPPVEDMMEVDDQPAHAAVIEFLPLECILCGCRFWECPECYCLLRKIAAHNCFNRWLENQLFVTLAVPQGCNALCVHCREADGCYHRFREL